MPARGVTTLGQEEIRPPPTSALLLHFPKSDGDPAIRPSPSDWPVRDASGRWNYFRPVPLDEKTSTEWRRKIGSKVAGMMSKPNADKYYLADWPSGYAFFDHNKERVEGDMRHDPYLYGSPHCPKFRSTNEFIPHAYWLMTTSTLDNSECACKYCAKKKGQTEVNEVVLGVASKPTAPGSTVTKTPAEDKSRKARAKGKAQGPRDSDSTLVPSPPMRLSRNEHRAKQIKHRLPLNIAHVPPWSYTARKRFQELHTGRFVRDGELIWFRLSTPICYSGDTGIAIDCWPAFAEDIEHRKQVIQGQDRNSFTVKESVYIVTRPLMGGNTVVKVLESSIIPYRAWEVDRDLVELIKQMAQSSDLGMTSQSPVFDPRGCNGELAPGADFRHVAPYFAMAVQTAAHMDLYWTPMFQIAGDSIRSATFQGLWLGAERIWLDDVVRMVPSHEHLISHNLLKLQIPPPFDGSETRSLFMRINEISVDNVLTDHGARKVCRVSGPIFCTVADPSYKLDPSGSSMLPPSVTNTIPGVRSGNHFPFPIPPLGFQYRSLTADDQEVVLDASMIAGRYYPRLYLSTSLDMPSIQVHRPGWWVGIAAMSGLASSQFSRCNAQFLMRERREAAEFSEKAARSDFARIATPEVVQ